MSDAKYFQTTKRGEIHELKEELHTNDKAKQKEAVKKVIAAMTVGKDVSMLFTDVLNCIQTTNIELKKLVYLYLINYSKSQPELTLLAVNTFVKDANDPNPLIRALAVRTMGCIRVEKITEYLCEPLSRSLRDEDPYVRKTAAVCVAKLYDIAPELVEDRGFLEILHDLISDANPSVVANAVAALSEIAETSGKDVMKVNTSVLQKLLAALNECTEWGQVFILDSLSKYTPVDDRGNPNEQDAEKIIERVTPRLQHANSAVVMSAVKVILNYMNLITSEESINSLSRKLAPPLVTLLNSEHETQYVALRNINLIVQKRPNILTKEIKVFFAKYNDPIYVKMEKLEIIIKLASERNIEQVLLELKEYATEVDVEFVRKSVSAIGRCAIKLERAAERCISVLLELIQSKVNYVVQEAVVVIKDIFRRYPDRYESVIATLCENLDTLDEPEAKASMIWIIGQYAERIDNADELLETFLESFEEEEPAVQLQLLTATVKYFLKASSQAGEEKKAAEAAGDSRAAEEADQKAADAQETVQRVLDMATEESDNPDLRDRGFVYWRLLSTDPDAAWTVVLCEKPVIEDDTSKLEPALLDQLIMQIATLSSIYHKPPEVFVTRANVRAVNPEDEDDEGGVYEDENDVAQQSSSGGAVDLLDMGGVDLNGGQETSPASASANDLFGFDGGSSNGKEAKKAPKTQVVTADKSGGIEVFVGFTNQNGSPVLEMDINNQGQTPVNTLAIQLNKNAFGLAPTNQQLVFNPPVMPGSSGSVTVVLAATPASLAPQVPGQPPSPTVQAAVKNMTNGSVFYFNAAFPFEAMFTTDGALESSVFINSWKNIPDTNQILFTVQDLPSSDADAVIAKLGSANVSFIARRAVPTAPGQEAAYFSCKTLTAQIFLVEITFKQGVNVVKVCIKTANADYSGLAKDAIQRLLNQ
jgi:AP-1 complex subunit beta-1